MATSIGITNHVRMGWTWGGSIFFYRCPSVFSRPLSPYRTTRIITAIQKTNDAMSVELIHNQLHDYRQTSGRQDGHLLVEVSAYVLDERYAHRVEAYVKRRFSCDCAIVNEM